jgi:hypothetical protein
MSSPHFPVFIRASHKKGATMRRIVLIPLFVLISLSVAFACGTERWSVKTGTDRGVAQVNSEPQATTIDDLSSINAPRNPNSRKNSRFPVELKTFQITGILTIIKKEEEEDEDYHLVMADSNDEDLTMIVESPNPGCSTGSRFLSEITEVRRALDQKFGAFLRDEPNIRVMVTGVAFFDRIHGQEGVASNGIELHPILALEFR